MIRIKLGRKLVKVFGLYISEVEHWSPNTKVRGSNPRIAQIFNELAKKMTDVITVNSGSLMATHLRWSTNNISSQKSCISLDFMPNYGHPPPRIIFMPLFSINIP